MPGNNEVLTKGKLAQIVLVVAMTVLLGVLGWTFTSTKDSVEKAVDTNTMMIQGNSKAIQKNSDSIHKLEQSDAIQDVKTDWIIETLKELKDDLGIRSRLPNPPTRTHRQLQKAIDSLNHKDSADSQ